MFRKYILMFWLVFCLSTPATGGKIGDAVFPDQLTQGQAVLKLNGLAMRTFTFFDVYAAALYLGNPSNDAQSILGSDTPRAMVMHFLSSVEAEKISAAWIDGLAANTPSADASIKERFAQLSTMMEKMDKGEAMECIYEPGTGTTVRVKGTTKGVIKGKDFNDALLACWIGPKPGPGEKFRVGILGNTK